MAEPNADLKRFIEDALKPIQTTLTNIETRVAKIETDVTGIKEDVTKMERRMDMMEAREENARAGLQTRLKKVPLLDGTEPPIFPEYISWLMVDGSELAVGGDKVPEWNKEKSLLCIRQYDPGYETEDDNATPSRKDKSSRRRRVKLAGLIGVTSSQMQLAVMQTFV